MYSPQSGPATAAYLASKYPVPPARPVRFGVYPSQPPTINMSKLGSAAAAAKAQRLRRDAEYAAAEEESRQATQRVQESNARAKEAETAARGVWPSNTSRPTSTASSRSTSPSYDPTINNLLKRTKEEEERARNAVRAAAEQRAAQRAAQARAANNAARRAAQARAANNATRRAANNAARRAANNATRRAANNFTNKKKKEANARSDPDFLSFQNIVKRGNKTEIKKAFRKFALKYHPDKISNNLNPEVFSIISGIKPNNI